jgi:hypothetical protein
VELKEVKLFLTEENPTLADLFYNENWLCNLFYLTDISEKLKLKYRTRLTNVEDGLRAALLDIEPRFDLLRSKTQAHLSH